MNAVSAIDSNWLQFSGLFTLRCFVILLEIVWLLCVGRFNLLCIRSRAALS
jgi:hypothetical protein